MEEIRPPEADMVQRIADIDGTDRTGDFVRETKQTFRDCLRSVFLAIARTAYLRDQDATEEHIGTATDCYNRYFQSLKGQTNISPDMVEQFVRDEEARQAAFYQGLYVLKKECEDFGIELDVLPPENVYCEPAWNSDLSVGTTLRVQKRSFLVAFPPVTLRTTSYQALTQEPVAADILTVNDRFIVLHPAGQDTDDTVLETFVRLFGNNEEVTRDVLGTRQAVRSNGYLLVNGGRERSDDELTDLRRKYSVNAIVTVSGFTATIHVPTGNVTERIFREIGTA